MDSPSIEGLVAMMTSLAESALTRLMRGAMWSWSGVMPSMGEMAPPRTW